MLADVIIDGNLGRPFRSQYIVALDIENSCLWLTPNASLLFS